MTKLEAVALEKLGLKSPKDLKRELHQEALDKITDEVVSALTVQEILDHVREVYDATADEYALNSHHQPVIDGLIEFMNLLPANGTVLDLGCGTGRDSLFMGCASRGFRVRLMDRKDVQGRHTHEKYMPPDHLLFPTGLDNSPAMIRKAKVRLAQTLEAYPHLKNVAQFIEGDMHGSSIYPYPAKFDGIWSCAALFTHSPRTTIEEAMVRIAAYLKPGGILAISYTNGQVDDAFDKLLISSTGRIKYFSHPDPLTIQAIASRIGNDLRLIRESYDDFMPGTPQTVKNLFVSQVFKKDAE